MEDNRKYFLGPAIVPQSILKHVPYAVEFNEAAYMHDFHYAKGTMERDKADVKFCKDMGCAIELYELGLMAQFFRWCVYYPLVRTFGWLFYNKKKK